MKYCEILLRLSTNTRNKKEIFERLLTFKASPSALWSLHRWMSQQQLITSAGKSRNVLTVLLKSEMFLSPADLTCGCFIYNNALNLITHACFFFYKKTIRWNNEVACCSNEVNEETPTKMEESVSLNLLKLVENDGDSQTFSSFCLVSRWTWSDRVRSGPTTDTVPSKTAMWSPAQRSEVNHTNTSSHDDTQNKTQRFFLCGKLDIFKRTNQEQNKAGRHFNIGLLSDWCLMHISLSVCLLRVCIYIIHELLITFQWIFLFRRNCFLMFVCLFRVRSQWASSLGTTTRWDQRRRTLGLTETFVSILLTRNSNL